MTTTANRAGLRANAARKTAKAAQRTPLPSKDHAAKLALAKEALADRKTSKAKAKAAPAPVEKLDKAGHYAEELSKLGWRSEVTRVDGLHELVAQRGAGTEAIYLAWLNEAHVSGTSTYTYADRTVKVRNPAEAMRVAATTPEAAKASQVRVSANKSFVKRATGPSVRHVPFDVTSATEDEIAAALAGHLITWHNQYRVESETATVGNFVHVSRHARGHRIVSFVDPESGYRAFKLENLENVGRKVNIERIKQEILASLTREARRQERRAA